MDDTEKRIMEAGYIQNEDIYRKWIAPEFLRFTKGCAKTKFAKRFIIDTPYSYAWTSAGHEIKALAKQKQKDERFWNRSVIRSMAKNALSVETNDRAKRYLHRILHETSYDKLHYLMREFIRCSQIPPTTNKPAAWKNAFLASGSWHTMQAIILFDSNMSVADKKYMMKQFANNVKHKSGKQLFEQTYTYINNAERGESL